MIKAHKLKISTGLISICLILAVLFGIAWRQGNLADQIQATPLAPTDLVAIDENNYTQVNLGWADNATNETGYKIERSMSVWHEFDTIATLPANTTTFVDNTNFATNHRYYYKVKAFNQSGDSADSTIITPTRYEEKDYLASTGDFENSFLTKQQRYTGPSTAVNETVESKPDNSVATNWTGITQYNLNSESDYYYRIVEGGVAGSNQQCFGVKNNSEQSSKIYLRTFLTAGKNIKTGEFNNGDSATFTLDQLSYADLQGLPANVSKNISLSITTEGAADGLTFQSEMNSSVNLNDEPESLSIKFPVEVTGHANVIVSSISITFIIEILGSDNLGFKSPGICLDGAHFFIQKSGYGSNTEVIVPARYESRQKSFLSHAQSNLDDPYYIAENYDEATMAYGQDSLRLPAKYFNPNLKFYIYTSRSFSDYRASRDDLNDSDASLPSENRFAWLLANHPEWFISYDPAILTPPSGDNRQDYKKTMPLTGASLDYVFDDYYQTEYMIDLTDPSSTPENWVVNQAYIDWWKTASADLAIKRGFDGVFVDVSAMRTVAYKKTPVYSSSTCAQLGYSGVNETISSDPLVIEERCLVYDITVAQAGKVLAQLVPFLRSNNLEVMMNCGGCHLGQSDADNFFDPNYSENNNANTPDCHFQEHSFFGITPRAGLFNYNSYRDLTEWNNVIEDMERYQTINESLSQKEQKKYYVSSYGFNKTEPDPSGDSPMPADPIDLAPEAINIDNPDSYNTGWSQFVIASYLMGASDNTYLSIVYDDYNKSIASNERKERPLDNFWLNWVGAPSQARSIQYQGQNYSFDDSAVAFSNKNLNFRLFENGLSVVNADKNTAHNFIMPGAYQDEYGRIYPTNSKITLLPHTGRTFITLPAPEIHLISPSEGASVKDSSVTLSYLVDGIFKEKTVELSLGANNLEITESNPFDASLQTTLKFTLYRSDSIALSANRYAYGWNMVSFPDISDSDPLLDILPETFKARSFNPFDYRYEKAELSGSAALAGLGYWMRIDDPGKAGSIKYLYNTTGSVTVPVARGWNLLGNPFQADLYLNKISFLYKDNTIKSFSDASASRDISGYAWSYEATATPKQYYFVSDKPERYKTSARKQTYINPYRGFWIIIRNDNVQSAIINR